MAKEIKINIRLITDGKEQGCDLLKIHYLSSLMVGFFVC